jgi:Fe-S-cluster containining protein
MSEEFYIFDCLNYPCKDKCCSYGVDVKPEERDRLLREGYATAGQFTGPTLEDDGELWYRTAVGPRGCVFLKAEDRGCSLHQYDVKPLICNVFPRDEEEAREMFEDGNLPCFHLISFADKK